jgi:hypothetical protein
VGVTRLRQGFGGADLSDLPDPPNLPDLPHFAASASSRFFANVA